MNALPDLLHPSERFSQERIALMDPEGASVNYRELWERVACLGARLRQAGIAEGHAVGIYLPKNHRCVIAICSVLTSGAAYVPVDPSAPARRIAGIFTDCKARAIIVSDDRVQDLIAQLACRIDTVTCGEPGLTMLMCDWDPAPAPAYAAGLAVILYTSGSTGTPKGVQLTHGNVLTFIGWCLDTFELAAEDVCVSFAPVQFDLSLFDLFVSLYRGASILLLEHKVCQNPLLVATYFAQYRVAVCYATPTMLNMLLRYGRLSRFDLDSLRLVLFAGEEFPIAPLRELQFIWRKAHFFNLYGPTESNVVTFQPIPDQIDSEQCRPFPIGWPCEHVRCMLATADGMVQPLPQAEGELLVSGPSVTPGYYAEPDKNTKAFLSDGEGRRYYRTGDFVRVGATGALQFLGRQDRTIKRRGYRIALEELERVLGLHAAACEVAVKSIGAGSERTIDAYFVTRSDCQAPAKSQLKQHCLEHLPAYFLPDRFVLLDSLPKTGTGKIDYQNLGSL